MTTEGVSYALDGNTRLSVIGIDKQLVGEEAARIRRVRPPEPYKGKGIRYAGEQVRRKAVRPARPSNGIGRPSLPPVYEERSQCDGSSAER